MPRLKLGIQRVNNIVFGRVLVQDEALRGMGRLAAVDIDEAREIRTIISDIRPMLGLVNLYIRGSLATCDNQWFGRAFDGTDDAIQAVNDIKALVAQVNQAESKTEDDCGLEIIV